MNAKPSSWCPKSGQLLSAFVQAFRLDDPSVGGTEPSAALDRSSRTVKDYFSGDWVGVEQRQRICRAAATALLNSGVLGDIALPTGGGAKSPEVDDVIAAAVIDWLSLWDQEYRSLADLWPDVDRALATFVLARPIVIDAALRWTSLCQLQGETSLGGATWIEPNGGSDILRAVLDVHWPDRTVDGCAVEFGVDSRTVERWLQQTDPHIPSDENLRRIAEKLARRSHANESSILVKLRREYGMFALLRSVADVAGWRFARKLGAGLVQLAQFAMDDFGDGELTDAFRLNHALSLRLGALFPSNAVVLDELLKRDLGPQWNDDVSALRDGQLRERISRCLRVLGSLGSGPPPELPGFSAESPEVKREAFEMFVLWAMNDNTATPERIAASQAAGQVLVRITAEDDRTRIANRILQAEAFMTAGNFRGAVPYLAHAVALDPTNARYRFSFGVALWQAGERERGREELRESCRLDPDWDRPFVELAIVWLNQGVADQALFHLHTQAEKFRARSDHFNSTEGIILRLLGRLDEALAAFERATELNQKAALAFDLAADCAFRLLDKVKGRRYAKRAYDLGRFESYRRYREHID